MFKLIVVYEKKKVELKLNGGEKDLRNEIKKTLKLQVPPRVITLSKLPFTNGSIGNNNNSKTGIRKLMTAEEEVQLSRELKNGDTIYAAVAPFEIVDDQNGKATYVCCGEELGSGAFSQVYRGYNKQTKQQVAIKVVDVTFLDTPKAKEYHEHEKEIISIIRHENIVQLYDLIENKEIGTSYFYIVMEFVEGGSLDHHIRNKPLNEVQARKALYQLGKSLDYLQSKKIIHRDLKPQNILLTSKNIDEATLKICDFGFSRYYSDDVIASHPGTPLYESPDMLHNRPYNDNKSEMWSVGCIFYEMLSGKPLFSTVKSISELRAAVNQNPREYIKFPPEIKPSRDCLDLLYQLMERDSNKRITLERFFRHPFLDNSYKRSIYCVPLGLLFEVEITEETNVSALKSALEKYSSIGRDHQLLLNEQGEVLQDTMFVTTTTNNTKTHMYLYNKNQSFVPADFEQIPVTFGDEIEPLQVSMEDAPIKKLLQYKDQFARTYRLQQGYYETCYKAHKKFEENLPLCWVQVRGLKALCEHYSSESGDVEKALSLISSLYLVHNNTSTTLLSDFEPIMSQLHNIALHESLVTPKRKYLIDCINEAKTREDFAMFKILIADIDKWLDNAKLLQKTLENKPTNDNYSQWQSFSKLKEKMKTAVMTMKTACDTMYQDYMKASREVENARKAVNGNGLRVDVSSALEEMLLVGKDQLHYAQQNEKEINQAMVNLLKLKATTHNSVTSIFDMKKKVSDLTLAVPSKQLKLLELERILDNLQLVIKLPLAYGDYISEMTRRSLFQRVFDQRVQLTQDLFKKMIDEENSRIELFRSRVGTTLSPTIFPGVEITNYDSITTITTPSNLDYLARFGGKNLNVIKAEDEDFHMLVSDYHDPNDLLRENAKLRDQITNLLRENKKNINVSPFLEENTKLKEKLQQLQNSQERFFDDYEKRFVNSQQKLKSAEEKEKTLIDTIETLTKTNNDLHISKEQSSQSKNLEEKLKELSEKLLKLENERLSQNQLVNNLQNQLQVEKDKKEQAVKQVNEIQQINDFYKNQVQTIVKKEAMNTSEKQKLEQQAVGYKEQCDFLKMQMEKLCEKTKMSLCPICSEVTPVGEIFKHVEGNHQ